MKIINTFFIKIISPKIVKGGDERLLSELEFRLCMQESWVQSKHSSPWG